jgi:tetratricopeptide (TPR) repeat protein
MSAILMIDKGLPPQERRPISELARLSLTEYLATLTDLSTDQKNIVLILDQFEEILTIDPTDREAKEEFFEQLGTALRNPKCWALFSMREDYVAALEPYLRKIPTRLSNTFRLDLLGEVDACEAIQNPARQQGVLFQDEAAQKLVNDLRTIRVQQLDGNTEEQLGQHVEPVHLQVVCCQLWEKLPDKTKTIEIENIVTSGDVNAALAGYYAERVKEIAVDKDVNERSIRGWFNNALITEEGIRGQVLHTPGSSQGLDDRAIWPLIDAHLVRAEKRRGATWFELAHDRLIRPIQSNNAEWLEKNLEPFQRQAELWDRQKRPDGLLLHDAALVEAEDWAGGNNPKLIPVERDFLKESQDARTNEGLEQERLRQQAEKDRRQIRRFRRLAYLTSVVSVISVILFFWAFATRKTLARTASDLQSTVTNLRVAYGVLNQQTQELTDTKKSLDTKNGELIGANTTLTKTLSDLNTKNEELKSQRDKAQRAEKDAAENLKVDQANRLGAQAYQRGQMWIAVSEFNKALGLYKERRDSVGQGWALSNIGLAQLEQGGYDKASYDNASKSYLKALKVLQRAARDKSPEALSTLDGLGRLFEAKGNYSEAERYFGLALEIRKATLHPAFYAMDLDNLARVYLKQNMYDKAIQYYKEELVVKDYPFSSDRLSLAKTHDELGSVYRQLGLSFATDDSRRMDNFHLAIDQYEQVLELREANLDPYHEDVAAALTNLSSLYGEVGESIRKSDLEEIVKGIRNLQRGPDTPEKAIKFSSLGDAYRRTRHDPSVFYSDTIWLETGSLYDRAIEIEDRIPGIPIGNRARHLDYVAAYYAEVGIYNQAIHYYAREIALRREHARLEKTEENVFELVETLATLASCYEKNANLTQANSLYSEAFQIAEANLENETRQLNESLSTASVEEVQKKEEIAKRVGLQGDLYYQQSRYEEAARFYRVATAFWQRLIGPEKRIEYWKAISAPQGALNSNDRNLISFAFSVGDSREYIASLLVLVDVYVRQNKPSDAESVYKEALELLQWYGRAFSQGVGRTDWPSISTRYGKHGTRFVGTDQAPEKIDCLNSQYYASLAKIYEEYATLLAQLNRPVESDAVKLLAQRARVDQNQPKVRPCF